MSKVRKARKAPDNKTMKLTKRDIGKALEETIEWIRLDFEISKSSKKIKRLTKAFSQKLTSELKHLVKKQRKKTGVLKKFTYKKLKENI